MKLKNLNSKAVRYNMQKISR